MTHHTPHTSHCCNLVFKQYLQLLAGYSAMQYSRGSLNVNVIQYYISVPKIPCQARLCCNDVRIRIQSSLHIMISEHKVIVCKSQLYWHDEIIAGLPQSQHKLVEFTKTQWRPGHPIAARNCENWKLLWSKLHLRQFSVFDEDDLLGNIEETDHRISWRRNPLGLKKWLDLRFQLSIGNLSNKLTFLYFKHAYFVHF